MDNDIYELAKLAVIEKYKGKGVGKKLMQFAFDQYKAIEAKKIILYTAKKLEAAFHLCVQFDFIGIIEKNQKYQESDTKMELLLNKK